MTTVLTQQYIDDHMISLHTPDSFGRCIIEQALRAAKTTVGPQGSPSGSTNINALVTVSSVSSMGCIQVSAVINGVTVTYHQSI